MASPRRKSIRFSRLYSFFPSRPPFSDEHSQIGQKGYSRVVYCNEPDHPEHRYPSNCVSTTKYTAFNFIPKSLFEQFRRFTNIYFLVVAFVACSIQPLLLTTGPTLVKEAIEDCRRRKQDRKTNNLGAKVYHHSLGKFLTSRWKSLRVGDLVKVMKDDHFPADLLLLCSSYKDGICYVETKNLDGETNLKVKQALDVTCTLKDTLKDTDSVGHFKAVIRCEDPNKDLYSFVGTLDYNRKQYPVSLQQLILRASKLRNTDYVIGVVVSTAHDTKIMQNNAVEPFSKRSKIERKVDKIVYVLCSLLVFVSLIGSFFFGIMTENDIDDDGELRRWYLRPDQTTVSFDPNRAALAALLHVPTGVMLYGYLVPISLHISVEIVRFFQVIFINQDIDIYHEETDRRATSKASNLNEELGLVDTILSDKTGTLTCNSIEFVKCSIAGTAYGRGLTEVERVLARRRGDALDDSEVTSSTSVQMAPGKSVKGFNFHDDRVMNGQWVNEPHADMIQKFFRVLALCHTAIPEVNGEGKEILYEAESPDEAAFVIAARELGFEMYERKQSHISLRELDRESHQKIDRQYELLHVLEFSSSRRRMSVIVRNVENQLMLLSKGSDSVMLERLSKNSRDFEAITMDHVKRYAEAGLRTLVLAYRELSKEELSSWEKEFSDAKATVHADRDALVEAAADKIERDLILLGATAAEDKLQKGVPECIEKLEKAGIKIWMITGDKMEAAISIGYACSLLREDMEQIVITLDSPEIIELEKKGDKVAVAKASRQSIADQIRQGTLQLNSSGRRIISFALIIDGKSLSFVLSQNLKGPFFQLAVSSASVICYRSTPKQKALVTRLVKERTGWTTLAIGDGANDTGMLQEADIGVGISGVEGMQAVMSSDFAIAQFRFLERLLLVHGHWCYRRISMMMCYLFYKNIAFGLTLFWFEAYASFSGQPAYNDWYMSCYNVLFTSLPVIALGAFHQDVSPRLCLENPELYKEGIQDVLSWPRILGWILNGIICSVIIFFVTTSSAMHQAFRADGHVLDFQVLGVYMYSCVVWTVNCQMALSINYCTWMHHLVIWGSIAVWDAFLLIYGAFSPLLSTTAYQVFMEACGPSPFFWLGTLLVVVSSLLPYMLYRAVQTEFFPMPHDNIQEMAKGKPRTTEGEN